MFELAQAVEARTIGGQEVAFAVQFPVNVAARCDVSQSQADSARVLLLNDPARPSRSKHILSMVHVNFGGLVDRVCVYDPTLEPLASLGLLALTPLLPRLAHPRIEFPARRPWLN